MFRASSGAADLAAALTALLDRQNALGLTAVTRATVPFPDRPYVHPDPEIAARLLAGIENPGVRAIPSAVDSNSGPMSRSS